VNKFAELARRERPVATLRQATDDDLQRSRRHVAFLTPFGFGEGDELRAVFRDGDASWGAVAIHRQQGAFTQREVDLIADAGPLIARGIRRAILRSALAHERDRRRRASSCSVPTARSRR
jgi:hypothetical protein